jgi:diketogulonate reductase-like aldo/keto reductase
VTPARIAANAALFDFALDGADMAALDALDRGAAGAVLDWQPTEAP